MGIFNPYFPEDVCEKLSVAASANIFVETGTLYGNTAKWAGERFQKVHTIEIAENLYNQTKDELLSEGNIVPHLGDSRHILPQILKTESNNVVFWLDGHYSGGVTGGKENPCPLLEELDAIFERENDDVIFIDDARCYGAWEGYPSIIEICKKIEKDSKIHRHLHIWDDHIFIIPKKAKYMQILHAYIRERAKCISDLYIKVNSLEEKLRLKENRMRSLMVSIFKKTGTFNLVKKLYNWLKTILTKSMEIFNITIGLILYLTKKKIIYKIDGGLGSQMHQYAVGWAIEKCSGIEVYYDLSTFDGQQMDLLGKNERNWQLDKVHSKVKVKKVSKGEIFFYKKYLFPNKGKFEYIHKIYDENVLYSKKARYMSGDYFNARYITKFSGEIKQLYDFDLIKLDERNEKTYNEIFNSACSVAIHIRRGDYIGFRGDVADENYYNKAIDKMNGLIGKPINYFIFSNDIDYCKNMFCNRKENLFFVNNNGNNDGHLDMYLMSFCHNFIICSSSVGWWAAFLSKKSESKIVIKPKMHHKNEIKEEIGWRHVDGWFAL